MEPTGIVDLLTTTVPARSTGAISWITASTAARSAAPVSDCGVCTQRNTNSAARAALVAPTTNRNRRGAQAFGHQRGQALFEDRHLALRQRAHALLVEVGAGDRVPEAAPGTRRW